MEQKLKELPVETFLQVLAGDDGNAPGGGSMSALAGALGAAGMIMVAKLTAKLKRFEQEAPLCRELAAKAAPYVQELTDGIDYDIACYNAIVAAYRLPKQSEEEIALRKEAVAQATLQAAEAPFAVLGKAVELLRLCSALEGHYNPMAASDFAASVLQLRSCAKSAWHNVLANVGGIAALPRAQELRAQGERLHAEAMELSGRLVLAAEKQLEG